MSQSHLPRSASARELRLRAVVERVSSASADYASSHQVVHLSQPTRAADGRPIGASSVLLDHDSPWQEAGVQPGYTVLFTTTARFVLEQVQTPARQGEQGMPIRWRKVVVLGTKASDITIARRPVVVPQRQPIAVAAAPSPRQRKSPVLMAAVAALVLAALGGGAIGWWAGSRPMTQPTSRTAS